MLEGGVKKILPTMYFFGMYLLRYFMYGIRTGSDLTKAKKGLFIHKLSGTLRLLLKVHDWKV